MEDLVRRCEEKGALAVPACRLSTVPVTDWPQTPAGLWGSRFVRRFGRAGPGRGTSSQTAWCGVSRFKA
ncbi:hypothetical protein ACWEJ7_30925, partial [Streptomyces albidoflavus]